MLGAVASSPLRIDLIAVPVSPILRSFPCTLAASTPTAGIHAAIGRERLQGEYARAAGTELFAL
jgi:hypothetical protein